jgi:hypothetical protein
MTGLAAAAADAGYCYMGTQPHQSSSRTTRRCGAAWRRWRSTAASLGAPRWPRRSSSKTPRSRWRGCPPRGVTRAEIKIHCSLVRVAAGPRGHGGSLARSSAVTIYVSPWTSSLRLELHGGDLCIGEVDLCEDRSVRGPVDDRSWLWWVIDNVVWINSWPSIAGAGCSLICVGASEEWARKVYALRGLQGVERQVGLTRGAWWPAGSSAGRMVARKARRSRRPEPV